MSHTPSPSPVTDALDPDQPAGTTVEVASTAGPLAGTQGSAPTSAHSQQEQPAGHARGEAAHMRTTASSPHHASLTTIVPSADENRPTGFGRSSGLANSSKSLAPAGATGLSQPATLPATTSSSTTVGDARSAPIDEMLTASNQPQSRPHLDDSDTSMVDHPTSGHLADSPPTAVVAPAAAAAPSGPISSAREPIPAAPAPFASAQQQQQQSQAQRAQQRPQERKEHEAAASSAGKGAGGPRLDFFSTAMASALEQIAAAAIAAASHAHTPPLVTTCHCLVVDESKLSSVGGPSDDDASFKAAMALARDRSAPAVLEQHVRRWLQQKGVADADISCVTYTDRGATRQLHIHLVSMDGLGRAQASVPFLVRCGALDASRWNKPCGGVPRNKLPEMLRFSCNPLATRPANQLASSVTAFLVQHHLEATAFWFPHSMAQLAQQRNGQQQSVTFYVLPRQVQALAEILERLHQKAGVDFWGGSVRVDCPNRPDLTRCTSCNALGHAANKCELYRGVAVRLLMKEPCSYEGLKHLVAAIDGARSSFLGSSDSERIPSRRITILFDEPDIDPARLRQQYTTIASSVAAGIARVNAIDLLHEPPRLTETKHRLRECRECGSMEGTAHVCPFAPPGSGRPANSSGSQPARAALLALPAAAAAAADVCRSWAMSKQCRRGQTCTWKHPADLIPTGRLCYEHQRNGFCSKGSSCRFDHPSTIPTTAAAAAVAPATVVSSGQPPQVMQSVRLGRDQVINPTPLPVLAAADQPAASSAVAHNSNPTLPHAAAAAAKRKRTREVDEACNGDEAQQAPGPASGPTERAPAKKLKHTPAAAHASSSNRFGVLVAQDEEPMSISDEERDAPLPAPALAASATPRRAASSGQVSNRPAPVPNSIPNSSLSSLGPTPSPTRPRAPLTGGSRQKKAALAVAAAAASAAVASPSRARPSREDLDEDMDRE